MGLTALSCAGTFYPLVFRLFQVSKGLCLSVRCVLYVSNSAPVLEDSQFSKKKKKVFIIYFVLNVCKLKMKEEEKSMYFCMFWYKQTTTKSKDI